VLLVVILQGKDEIYPKQRENISCILFTFESKITALDFPYTISPLNEAALLVSFENIIDEAVNKKVIALRQLFAGNHFKGFVETVPAYASLAVFYDAGTVRKYHTAGNTVFDFVKTFTEQLLRKLDDTTPEIPTAIITIPVYYNGDDLAFIANDHQLQEAEVVHIHTAKIYRVFMIGFLPGFTYMGSVDERIATARRSSPRIKVHAGSVGIAGFQTGIYPLDSPGGWQLLGQTPIKIFDKQKDNPCLLQAGDNVQFISISKAIFEELNEY
jgi:inhibitor of KinA